MKKILFATVFLFSVNAFSFQNFLNSSSILRKGEYDFSGVFQSYSSERSGAQVSGILDFAFTEETNLRVFGGFGDLDYSMGSAIKWIPFKDNPRTPFNLGGVASAEYGRDQSFDNFLFRASPFVSKVFAWELGEFEPYFAFPIGLQVVDSDSLATSQMVFGTKIKFESINFMSFSAEGGFKVKNAESYVALMATVHLRR